MKPSSAVTRTSSLSSVILPFTPERSKCSSLPFQPQVRANLLEISSATSVTATFASFRFLVGLRRMSSVGMRLFPKGDEAVWPFLAAGLYDAAQGVWRQRRGHAPGQA